MAVRNSEDVPVSHPALSWACCCSGIVLVTDKQRFLLYCCESLLTGAKRPGLLLAEWGDLCSWRVKFLKIY